MKCSKRGFSEVNDEFLNHNDERMTNPECLTPKARRPSGLGIWHSGFFSHYGLVISPPSFPHYFPGYAELARSNRGRWLKEHMRIHDTIVRGDKPKSEI